MGQTSSSLSGSWPRTPKLCPVTSCSAECRRPDHAVDVVKLSAGYKRHSSTKCHFKALKPFGALLRNDGGIRRTRNVRERTVDIEEKGKRLKAMKTGISLDAIRNFTELLGEHKTTITEENAKFYVRLRPR